ncbi:MAG: SMC-Scp complex subunit ScpB [Actinomycetota bacterium]
MTTGRPLIRALEAVLFVTDEPLPTEVLAQALEANSKDVEQAIAELASELEERGIVLRNVAGGWRLTTHPEAAPFVERFVLTSRHARLTKASLETLAIVAYKQPVTRHQIAAIRGVDSEGVLHTLIDRGLVDEAGHEDSPGRPLLYSTTPEFLERMGLPSVAALPPIAPLLDEAQKEAEPT